MDKDEIYKLENFIGLGYEHIENLEKEYAATDKSDYGRLIDKFTSLLKSWIDHVHRQLPSTAMARKKAFINAVSSDPTYQFGMNAMNKDVQSLIKIFRAKIVNLEGWRKELGTQASISVSGGNQTRVLVGGSTDNSTNVINNQKTLTQQLKEEFTNRYSGDDKQEALELIKDLENGNDDDKGKRQILEKLLTKGAEFATIATLISKLLALYSGG